MEQGALLDAEDSDSLYLMHKKYRRLHILPVWLLVVLVVAVVNAWRIDLNYLVDRL
jgi:hypothetical protein